MSGDQKILAWLSRWGFAVLVSIGVVVAVAAAWRVHVPVTVPDFALKAETIYRVEVGAGTFLGFYLVTMAFVLALSNRGFSEIGVNGLKAQDMANKAQQDAIQGHEELLKILREMMSEIEVSDQELQTRLEALEDVQMAKSQDADV